MRLQIYLAEKGESYAAFAKRVSAANASVVAKWVSGKQVPRPVFMAAIVKATGGKVQPNDFFTEAVSQNG